MNKNPEELTDEQLEEILKKRKEARAKKEERERKKYVTDRDNSIRYMMANATDLNEALTRFKQECHDRMEQAALKLEEYGEMRSNSKGGFSITSEDGNLRVTRRRDTIPSFDERSEKAIELIKEFLGDTVKKRDKDLYDILIDLLARNQNQDLEYSEVMKLLKHENTFDDPRWNEGLRLIKESYSNHLKGYAYEFKLKKPDGKWQTLPLNFSSL